MDRIALKGSAPSARPTCQGAAPAALLATVALRSPLRRGGDSAVTHYATFDRKNSGCADEVATAFAVCTASSNGDERGRTFEQWIEPDHAGISGSDAGQRVLGDVDLSPRLGQIAAQCLQIRNLDTSLIGDDRPNLLGSIDRITRRLFSPSGELASKFTSFLADIVANKTAPGHSTRGAGRQSSPHRGLFRASVGH